MGYLRLRQICLVAENLAVREREIVEVLGLEVCYHDLGVGKYGLENSLFAAGGAFLEIVSPTQPNTAGGRYLERRKGDGGYMFIVDCDDLEARREHFNKLGVRIVQDLKRGDDVSISEAIHLHPKDTGGCLLSVDRHSGGADMMGGYHWAGPSWQANDRSKTVKSIIGATMQCDDPSETAQRWSEILKRRIVHVKGVLEMPLDVGFARFVELRDDRGEGLCSVHLACRDRKAILANADKAGARRGDDVALAGVAFILSDA